MAVPPPVPTTGLRGSIHDLPSPPVVVAALPAMLQTDDFVVRFTEALGEALAPIFTTLDNLDAYFDADLAPADFLPWLAEWVGAVLDPRWSDARTRAAVNDAAEIHQWHGTVAGIARQVALLTGEPPEIVEGGGVVWSPSPGGPLPGEAGAPVVVKVRAPEGEVDHASLEALTAAAMPAHVTHRVEVGDR